SSDGPRAPLATCGVILGVAGASRPVVAGCGVRPWLLQRANGLAAKLRDLRDGQPVSSSPCESDSRLRIELGCLLSQCPLAKRNHSAQSAFRLGRHRLPRGGRSASGGRARADGGTVSQMRTVESPEAEASRLPSGLKATAWT